MSTTVSMPQLGETVTEGTILRWAKEVGDSISADEVLVEISTDKVDTEVPSPESGVLLEILVAEGDTVEVGTPIARIGDEGEGGGSEASDEPEDQETTEQDTEEETATQPETETRPEAPQEPEPEPAAQLAASVDDGPSAQTGSDTASSGEETTVSMPQLGETVTEGTILRWAKQVGDEIAEDEVLVEISTDKVDTEVPSPAAGLLIEILVQEGETVEVGTPIAVIGSDSASAAAPAGAPAEPSETPDETPDTTASDAAAATPDAGSPDAAMPDTGASEQAPTAPPSQDGGRQDVSGMVLSPVVRKLVREHDVDVSAIEGSGEGGRVTRKDVEAHIEQRGQEPTTTEPEPAPSTDTPEEASAAARPAPAAAAAPSAPAQAEPTRQEARPAASAAPPAAAEDEVVELDRLRVRIGQNMIRSKQTAAHVWTSVEVDFERIERIRSAHKAAFKEEEGFSLTYIPFIARATIDALGEYPVVNSSFYLEEKKAVFHKAVNLGIAIDLDQKGLVVASIRNADGLRLVGIARQIRSLAEKARTNKLEPDDVMGSTFTITNPGPFGSFMSAPIINVPNTGILSTDTVTKRPAVVQGVDGEDVIAIRHIGYLGLTWDHRAFDGSTAVLFLQRIKQNLENWDWEQELA